VPQPRSKARARAEDREILEAWIPEDHSRPVYAAIRTRFIDSYARYYKLLTEGVSNRYRKETAASSEQRARLDSDWTQLAELLFSSSNLWALRDWRKPPILKFLLRAIGRTRGGRPATKRQAAIQAMEMKLTDPKRWTWPKIASALCDCGKSHDVRCQDNLRREVLHLRKTLRKCGCRLTWEKPPRVSPMR
jgi:hypothetical protein